MTNEESPMSYRHEDTEAQREQPNRIYFDIEQIINRGSITNTDINEYVGVYLSNRKLVDQSKELLEQLEKLLETRMLQEIEELDEHMDFSGEINPIWSMLLFNSWDDGETDIGQYAISNLIEKIKNSKTIQDAARKKIIEFFSSIPGSIQQGEIQQKSHSQEHDPENDTEEKIATYKRQLERLFPQDIRDEQNIWDDPEVQKAREECLLLLAKNGNTDLIEQIQDRMWGGGPENTGRGEKEISALEEEMVQEKLKFAHVFVQFEFLLSSKEGLSLVDEFIDTLPKDEIPEYIRKKMREIAKKYEELQKKHDQNTELIQKLFPDSSPHDLGMSIFEKCTGEKPKNDINCVLQASEPYIIFEFLDGKDYLNFLQSRDDSTFAKVPGGTYHRSIDLHLGLGQNVTVKAICINTSSNDPRNIWSTLIHERQHFINETLVLPEIESMYYQNPWRIKKYGKYKNNHPQHATYGDRGMISAKDELLAYLREGTPIATIQRILTQDPLYPHINKSNEAGKISACLQDIAVACSHKLLKKMPRAQLVALLYEIPLERVAPFVTKLSVLLQMTQTQQLLKKQKVQLKTFQREIGTQKPIKKDSQSHDNTSAGTHHKQRKSDPHGTQWYIDQYEDGKFEGKNV